MAANADIFLERDNWSRPLAWSLGLHAALFLSIVLYTVLLHGRPGDSWGAGGGGGGAISASLVTTIPLPASQTQTQNIVANESKGLTRTMPKALEPVEPEAIPIPEKTTKTKPPKKQPSVSQAKATPPPLEDNVVPYGQGGPVSGPYGSFSAGGAKGGFGFSGGGGDFGSRYSWYVRVVQQKVSENWLKYEVDPRISDARRVYIVFDILRNGQPTNIEVEQSSGVPSLDQSAVRALQRIDTFGPLPSDYSGNKVSVEFWFDYRR